MPMYDFKRPDGTIVELFFHMADAPPNGETVVIDGVAHVRQVSPPRLSGLDTGRKFAKYPYASHALPRWTRPKGMDDLEFDKKGKPIIKSAKQEREYAARRNMVKH